MMRSTSIATGLLLLLMPISVLAAAPLPEPEDFLFDGSLFLVTNKRSAQERARQQRIQNAQNHQSIVVGPGEEPKHASAENGTASSSSKSPTKEKPAPREEEGTETEGLSLDPVLLRLLDRLERNRNHEAAQMNTNNGTEHSGAPLAGTGPAGLATVVVMAGSIVVVYWSKRKSFWDFE